MVLAGGRRMAGANSTRAFGLKISQAQREYYRYTEVSAEFERHGIYAMPRPDFTRLQRKTAATEADSKHEQNK